MMRASYIVATIIFCSLAYGCQTTAERLATFHGMDKYYLIGSMGKPDAKEKDGSGGEIWIYETRDIQTTPAKEEITYEDKGKQGKVSKRVRKIYPSTESIVLRFKSFYINHSGIIYNTANGSRYLQN